MYYNLTAIILKRQTFREDDLLITVYSRERGKLILQARGAKKIKSKLAGHLEPVSLSYLEVAGGKNIDQLIGARMAKSYLSIKNNLSKLAYASYFLELVDHLTVEAHKEEKIFELLKKAMAYLDDYQLSAVNGRLALARVAFGFKLLDILGLNPEQKQGIGPGKGIGLIVGSGLDKINNDHGIIHNLAFLDKILRRELEEHLNGRLMSKKFLLAITDSRISIPAGPC